jgi:hypothetical protein
MLWNGAQQAGRTAGWVARKVEGWRALDRLSGAFVKF